MLVFELREYLTENGMLLLIGGKKDAQKRDIQTARAYLADYGKRESGH